ncbi:unnamed protein product [Mycena citricolor]|uniref:Uncharacterized protein n=1 Tax=Mycena citricolor TaxID=2018698 RepID=A0AAD2K3F6_9AGAR|nr:unnamed protein product [Mycena citricolor]
MQTPRQQRRMTAPAASLQPPEGRTLPSNNSSRPPSPLRNTFTGIDPEASGSGDDEDDDRAEWTRSPSPSSSVSQMAASFARSMGSLVMPTTGARMPTDAELEAESQLARDRSRREAERILTKEAEDRRLVEDRVMAMMESTRGLPPPPARSQSMDPPSPSSSQKESSGWWAAAKNRLTPTKDLTPAQQVIQDTKARDKEKKSSKGKEKEWPANSQAKYTNPSYTSLIPPSQRQPAPMSSPSNSIPTTPIRPQASNMPPNLTPSPMRFDASGSPRDRDRETPPLYAHFDDVTGTLDVHVTLLTIAKRFEKLEKWTVGHVRALEERMGDVERWLVEKENEKEQQSLHENSAKKAKDDEDGEAGLTEIREGLHELQSRVTSLGREMAKLATAPANLSQATQARYPSELSVGPTTPSSSFAVPSVSPGPSLRKTATSPPVTTPLATGSTKLPYPSGDYASPPPDVFGASQTRSPEAVVSGLPMSSTDSIHSLKSHSSSQDLPIPKPSSRAIGRGSVSPTPRKRYTVALGGSVESDSDPGFDIGTAVFSGSDGEELDGGDTIGKSTANKLSRGRNDKEPRMRAQSAYGMSSILQASPNTTAQLSSNSSRLPHARSKSIDRFGSVGPFVDPLVLRKQSKDTLPKPVPTGKVGVGKLVAFFDGGETK